MKSWKTSLLGVAAGLIPIGQQVINALQNGQAIQWGQVAMGAALAMLGIFAKDSNVTGK